MDGRSIHGWENQVMDEEFMVCAFAEFAKISKV
jgi:hypothetical protein